MGVDNEANKNDWLGAVNGSASEQKAIAREDAAQRKEAQHTVILSQSELLKGKWDSGKLLQTTIGGQLRALTTNDLIAFKKNIKNAQDRGQ